MALIEEIKDAVGGALCSTFASYDRINRLMANVLYPDRVDDVLPLSPAGQIGNTGMAMFCDRPPVTPDPSWANGQCAQGYRVFSGTDYDGFQNGQGAARAETQPGNTHSGPFQGLAEIGSTSGSRKFYYVRPFGGPTDLLAYEILSTGINPRPYVQLQPVAGNPDNCGSPPPPPVLPEADRTTNINIRGQVGPIIFLRPTLNVNGDLSIPFVLEVGELNLSGTVELNTGDISLNFGGQPTDPDAPEVPTPDGSLPDADLDDPEPEKAANIIGVIVVSTPTGQIGATEIPATVMPDIFVPRIADVSFKIRIKSNSHWTSDVPVKSRNAYIPCPGDIDAIDVAVKAQKNWSIAFTPVRGIVPSNQVELV